MWWDEVGVVNMFFRNWRGREERMFNEVLYQD